MSTQKHKIGSQLDFEATGKHAHDIPRRYSMKKKIKSSPSVLVAEFANKQEVLCRLPDGINALSFRLAVNRHNKGKQTVGDLRLPIMLVRRTDEQTGVYYLARERERLGDKMGIEAGLKKSKAKTSYVDTIKNNDLRALARVVEMANESLPPDENTELHDIAHLLSTTRRESMGLDCGNNCHFAPPYGFVPEAGCPVHD